MNCFVILLTVVSVPEMALGSDIRTKVRNYFKSETTKNFNKQWDRLQVSFENTLNLALSSGYGRKGLNVYINRITNALELATGYYNDDNQVKMLLNDLYLTELPNLIDVDVNFPLASNLLSLEAGVGKMILNAGYMVFRNMSDIIFAAADQNSNQNSPFRFQQVAHAGRLAIIMEGCTLSGYTVATLSGSSVNIGHPAFNLNDCQYTVEVFQNHMGSPPVIANYLFNGSGININTLLLKPLLGELVPKLQAAMFSYINTSAIFINELPKIRELQENIFEESNNFEDELIRCMNKKAITNQDMGTVQMSDFELTPEDSPKHHTQLFSLTDVLLVGLDTLYSAHSGGPIQSPTAKYAEQIRFKTLQVTGKIGRKSKGKFAVEISDFAVNAEVDANMKTNFEVLGWRLIEFSYLKLNTEPVEQFVIGYLLDQIPKHVISHLKSVYSVCNNVI